MGLTALALGWLCWRIGGLWFAIGAGAFALLVLVALTALWRRRRGDGWGRRWITAISLVLATMLAVILPSQIIERSASASEGVIPAKPFSEAALAEARAAGKPVFVWFTADWCLTCKVNESAAIEREATRDAFAKAGVVALVGDWTRRDPAITRFLSRQGAAGVPLYLWYAPGQEAAVLPQVLTPDALVTLAERSPRAAR